MGRGLPEGTQPDPAFVAVDLARVGPASPAVLAWADSARALPALRGELRLVPGTSVPPAVRAELDARGALHPVFRHGDTRLVALPEVRVEVEPQERAAVRAAAEHGPVPAEVEDGPGGALTLRPRSGRGADALALADALERRLRPRLCQPRFLRSLPRADAPYRRRD